MITDIKYIRHKQEIIGEILQEEGPIRLRRVDRHRIRAEIGGHEFLFRNPENSRTGIEISGVLREKTGPETAFDQDRSRVHIGRITPSLYWVGIDPGPSCHVGVEDERHGSRVELVEITKETGAVEYPARPSGEDDRPQGHPN